MPRNPNIPKANTEYLHCPGQRKIKIDQIYTFPEFILPDTVKGEVISSESLEDKTQD